jgi:circadian clock protein KaiC
VQGEKTLTRHGLEEYVSDCVILLDHRVTSQMATRRLRIVKYRGTKHGTNEYPTLIDENGLSVLPISTLGLDHPVTTERVATGVARLDTMLGGKGFYRGSSVLISGVAGTGKTSLAAAFVDAACRRGERSMYFSFEESPHQLIRNMASIGLRLDRWVRKGLLRIQSLRPTLFGLEMHLANTHKLVEDFKPAAVVMDPITNLASIGNPEDVKAMLMRLIDYLKNKQVTVVFTSLTGGGDALEQSEVGISSLMDTWLLVRMLESEGELNRLLYVLKSRGMAHSNQMREFRFSDDGIDLVDVYVGPGKVLTGSARLNQEVRDRTDAVACRQTAERKQRGLLEEQASLEAQVRALSSRLKGVQAELAIAAERDRRERETAGKEQKHLAAARSADRTERVRQWQRPTPPE